MAPMRGHFSVFRPNLAYCAGVDLLWRKRLRHGDLSLKLRYAASSTATLVACSR
jgi:hypothetical protein